MLTIISFCLLVIGGINWLSIGILQFDLVAGIFGTQSNIFSRIIYVIIGIAAVYLTYIAISKKGDLRIKCNLKCDKNEDLPTIEKDTEKPVSPTKKK